MDIHIFRRPPGYVTNEALPGLLDRLFRREAPGCGKPSVSRSMLDDLSKHSEQLGASYATIPRLAERRTVRNFYQHNYPYAWVGARVAYDA